MKNASYKFLDIVLLESLFERKPNVHWGSEQIKANVNINVKHNLKEERLYVFVTLIFEAISSNDERSKSEEKEVSAKITMLGIFEFPYQENAELPLDDFANINAPAIIFPFIREHLASMSMKSRIPPILLDPVNFIKLYKDAKKKENK